MAITGLKLEGRLYGLKEIQTMYAAAPGAFFKAIRHRMYSERKRYIGTRGFEGKFRKKILAKKHSGTGAFKRDGTWPRNVAAAFKGYLRGDKAINTMEMHMGTGLLHPTRFSRGLAMMDQGYTGDRTISGNGKNMPLPVYKNLMNFYPGAMSRAFRDMSKKNELVPVTKGTKIYWFFNDKKKHKFKFKKSL